MPPRCLLFPAGLSPAGRGLTRLRYQGSSFRVPRGHPNVGLHQWAPGGSVGSRRGGCVADVFGKDAHQRSEALADRGSRRFPGILRARLGGDAGKARLRQIFAYAPGLADVMIRVNMSDARAGMPAKACGAAGGAGGQLSSGDRASLPGRSTRISGHLAGLRSLRHQDALVVLRPGRHSVCANALHGLLEL